MWRAIKFTLQNTWKSSKILFLIYLLTQIIIAISSLVNTFTFKEIIDAANGSNTILGLSLIGVIVFRLAYEIFRQTIDGASRYTWSILHAKQMVHYNELFFEKISTLDVAMFENPHSVGLINRAVGRINQFTFYLKGIVEIIASAVELSVSLIVFAIASPWISLLILIANTIPIYARSRLAKSSFRLYMADDETKRRYGYTVDLVTDRNSLPEIKLNKAFFFVQNRLSKLFKTFTYNQLQLDKRYQIINSLVGILPIVAVFIFSIVIANQLTNGVITTGTFVFLFTNVLVFSGALHRLSQNLAFLQQDANPLYDVTKFFEIEPNISFPAMSGSKSDELKEKTRNPEIVFENVSFSYPNTEKLVLKNINMKIEYGENVAIVGENGAGKTTLIKLLLRIYDPTEGNITVNGVDLKDFPEDVLFDVYSTLFQDFGKFYMTVRENLELAAGRKLKKNEIIKYLKFSDAWEFIKDTEKQVDQQLGPEYNDGIDLSGGQWQRLAIARAYAKNAPILVLDEPTSAVDAKSEMQIFNRINKQMAGNTLIFISHRFSTIKDAERIIVLQKGKIVEDGSHKKLMQQKGMYSNLYTIQANRYKRS